MTPFLTTKERKHRIAELAAEITANGGTPPQNCDGFKTSHEAKSEIAKMETILADCRAKKASAKPGTPMPLIACLADKTAVREAITARLEASKAAVAASAAKLRAQQAVAAIRPAASREPLTTAQKKAAAKAAAQMTPANAKNFTDSYLHVAATHRHSPPAEAAIAMAELESRGYVFSSGTISKSLK